VITVSEFNREHLSTLAGTRDARKVHRVYNGIDLQRFRPAERPRRDDLFLAIGRLIEKKGFTHLVEACRLLSDRGREFRCVVVGDGPDEESLRAQIRDADLERTVQLVGAVTQEQVVELMSEATATVLPCVVSGSGDRDGLPTVLLEALGSGLPAISTCVTGVPEIIDHESCGLLVPPADPAGLAEAMDRMLGNPELRDRFAVAARAKAERDFDLRCSVARLRRRFLDSAAQRPLRHEEHANAHRVRVG
jgi:glycosyltransferase involved in cell wall biosynthesis